MRNILQTLGLIIVLMMPWFCIYPQDGACRWDDVCEGSTISYCTDVGKKAYYNALNPITLRGIELGIIVGVVWREKGSLINPKGRPVLFAPQNAYYYIIDDGLGELFVKECSLIEVH